MSRGLLPDAVSPHPLGERLPAIYQEDSFTQRLTSALDQVLAPIFSSLDNLDAYLDPRLAPEDFLEWLAGWVGLSLDEAWPAERRQDFVAAAADLYRTRGTAAGLAAHMEIVTGGRVEVLESGGTTWSTTSGQPAPGRPGYELLVRVHLPDPSEATRARVDALVAAAKPAHVVHRVELHPVEPPA